MRRREFLGCSTAAAAGLLFLRTARPALAGFVVPPEADLRQLTADALDAAKSAGASYADIRINHYRNQFVSTREDQVQSASDSESFGFGVRVLANGAWGFSSSTMVTHDEVVRAAREAVTIAKANAVLQRKPVQLAPTPAYTDTWQTPITINPFDVPIQEKADLLLSVNREALKANGARYCESSLFIANENKTFASSEGSYIKQDIYRVWPSFEVTAVSADGSDFQSRAGYCMPVGRGYEYCKEYPLLDDARQAGEDAVAKLSAPTVVPGKRDLILMPSHMWLVIHESVAHATELDRALGFEANFAGTSFVTTDNLGKLKYGSDIVTIVGDRTETNGLSTVGYDDEGVKASRFDIIRNGTFVDYQTIREQAAWIGGKESHGCAYADSYEHMPMQRMPNVSLLPSEKPTKPEDLIAGVDDGILIKGNGSWSIDQQRRNLQFGGQVFHQIKGGKITGMLRDVAYQAMTVDFWNSCDGICSREYYELGGSYWCGKAQPEQAAPVSHGCAPSRFRNINFINTGRKV
ncbi:MAG TPA: TldD/PmbA family protein [Candidatus Kapabacteria bacterium]|nr:TldD/PmbA family protein [Candidatus Kapabacteria bacterium]